MSRLVCKSSIALLQELRPLAICLLTSFILSACATSDDPKTDPLLVAKLVSELDSLKKTNQEVLAESRSTGELLALLKVEVTSLKEQQSTTRRQLDVVRRGARSGIYEEQSPAKNAEKKTEKPFVGMDVPAIKEPDSGRGRSAHSIPFQGPSRSATNADADDDAQDNTDAGTESEVSAGGAQADQILADAQLNMQRANFGEAVVALAQLQKEKPNFEDNGLAALLLAECWLKLGQPENALPVLRGFYLKHPQSPNLLKAKILEGHVLEKSGAREKALVVYREVLALGPETAFAREARTALGRMRDAR